MTWRWTTIVLPASVFVATPAAAQVGESLTVQLDVPQDFDRGRNISVLEQPRPDYAPVGVAVGALRLYPRVESGGGGTSNTYLTSTDAVAAPYVYLQPSARLASGWSRHFLQISGTTTLRDYVGEARRNERLWDVGARGRLDVRRSFKVESEVNTSRNVENLFSGEVVSTVAALSRFRRDLASVKATYTGGQMRTFALLDYTSFQFAPVLLASGGVRDQSDRNRHITRLTGQFEYARTPSVALFMQLSGSRTEYSHGLLTGSPNLNSGAIRLLGGANVDIAGGLRGTIGLGYSIRDFDASSYKTIRGLSVETKVDAFPSPRLTVGLIGQRTIQDSPLGRGTPYWNTRFNLHADYELLRNIILSASGDHSRQRYIDSSLRGGTYRATASGRYIVSRRISLKSSLNYSHQSSNNTFVLGSLNEARIEAGVAYQM
jgi:hypothetical protein